MGNERIIQRMTLGQLDSKLEEKNQFLTLIHTTHQHNFNSRWIKELDKFKFASHKQEDSPSFTPAYLKFLLIEENMQEINRVHNKFFFLILSVKTTTKYKIQAGDKYLHTEKDCYHLIYKEHLQNTTKTFYGLQRKMDKGHEPTSY